LSLFGLVFFSLRSAPGIQLLQSARRNSISTSAIELFDIDFSNSIVSVVCFPTKLLISYHCEFEGDFEYNK